MGGLLSMFGGLGGGGGASKASSATQSTGPVTFGNVSINAGSSTGFSKPLLIGLAVASIALVAWLFLRKK